MSETGYIFSIRDHKFVIICQICINIVLIISLYLRSKDFIGIIRLLRLKSILFPPLGVRSMNSGKFKVVAKHISN